ncbi:MAG: ferric reductase-like transmembrane domain-containing protein [Gaiellaceae bacterium]
MLGVVLGAAVVVVGVEGLVVWRERGVLPAATFVSGYLAIALLVVTLLIGPVQRLARRRSPAHIRFRRRVGVSAAVVSAVHTGIGLQIHLGGHILRYFTGGGRYVIDEFRLANWAGLIALLALAPALVTSSDRAMSLLGLEKWKRLQRLALLAGPLALLHAIAYEHLLKAWPWIAALAIGGVSISMLRLAARPD